MQKYDPKQIEPKWQKIWNETELYKARDDDPREKYYYLAEFPYPSGDGLHVGHVRSFTALDIMARHKRMQGFNVLYPMGWDAFGLPTENYAIKNKIAPQVATEHNVNTFRRQMKSLGLGFDWSREVNTTDPKYYRWTQWIFLQLLKAGLAYQAEIPINWCPFEKTGLANEEVVNGRHERCGTVVEKKLLKQWLLKITAYADRLIEDLKTVDYLDRVVTQQINWIGKSEGAEITFGVRSSESGVRLEIGAFTTRPDTLAGATFLVLAPEHPLVGEITTEEQKAAVDKYIKKAQSESDMDRQDEARPKTGVWTGAVAINPLTNEEIPVWIADYVLMGYGTGAIMAVPAHDARDFEFAKKFKLPVKQVIRANKKDLKSLTDLYVGSGTLINSGKYDGLDNRASMRVIVEDLYKAGQAKHATKYKLRDWIFSRQHYWGEPIPVVHCPKCGVVPVPEDQLPLELPKVEHYEPTDTGESPLAAIKDWVNTTCPNCGGPAKRETDTMPNWAGSSWYYLRYIDPNNNKQFAAMPKLKHWLMVDLYNGGMEHTTLHLLYSRFWHKFLYDQKLVPTPEPYARRRSHGMILGPDNQKMSKSRGNVINPDGVVNSYGADSLRLYEMFMGPYDQETAWSDERLAGVSRFIYRVWQLSQGLIRSPQSGARSPQTGTSEVIETVIDRMTHKTLKKVHEDIEQMHFNTMVSALMEYVNFLNQPDNQTALAGNSELAQRTLRYLILMLAPALPHLAEELWSSLGEHESVHIQPWPAYDPELIKDDVIEIIVQVNGKLRGTFVLPADEGSDQAELKVGAEVTARSYLKGKQVIKTIVVPRKLVNFVVK